MSEVMSQDFWLADGSRLFGWTLGPAGAWLEGSFSLGSCLVTV